MGPPIRTRSASVHRTAAYDGPTGMPSNTQSTYAKGHRSQSVGRCAREGTAKTADPTRFKIAAQARSDEQRCIAMTTASNPACRRKRGGDAGPNGCWMRVRAMGRAVRCSHARRATRDLLHMLEGPIACDSEAFNQTARSPGNAYVYVRCLCSCRTVRRVDSLLVV